MKKKELPFSRRPERVRTGDGSHSLYVEELDEFYHSTHGALQESKHVFLKEGMIHFLSKVSQDIGPLKILEVGFGTGSNALLTLAQAKEMDLRVHYTTLETVPLEVEEVQDLGYAEMIGPKVSQDEFIKMHKIPFGVTLEIAPEFLLRKEEVSVHEFRSSDRYHVIFYDAFAPRAQPDMWVDEVFSSLFSWTVPGGVVVTYCAKGAVKRGLKDKGFEVETLPGPPGKREMVRAVKPEKE